MFTTFGYAQSIDQAGAWSRMNALADPTITVASPEIVVPSLNKLILAAAGISSATVINGARFDAPSIRDIVRPNVQPVNLIAAADVTPNDPARVLDRRFNPLTLNPGENVEGWTIGDPAAAHWQWLLGWLADAPIAPIAAGAEIQSARFTATTTLVADQWTNAAISFDDQLAVGHYQVVGLRAEAAGLICARLFFKGFAWRPGALGCLTPQMYGNDVFRNGNLGVYGEFDSVAPPTIDFLSISADTAEYGILDLIKTA
jgi:hypothetical protein